MTIDPTERQFERLVANIPGAVYRCRLDADYTMVFLSEAIQDITGYPASDFIENRVRSYASIIHPEDADVDQEWEREVTEGHPFETVYRILHADGGMRWVWERGRAVFDDGVPVFIDGVFFDLTEQKEAEEGRRLAEEELRRQAALNRHQALHDDLTGLPNRNCFREAATQALAEAADREEPLAIVVIDLDRFKEINDTLGHHCGDLLIGEVAKRLRSCVRGSDLVARLGGDEFALLLPTAREESAVMLLQRIERELARPLSVHDLPLAVEASMGVAFYPADGEDIEVLMQRADVAMYAAKDSGESYAFYDPTADGYTTERLLLVGELRRALDDGELVLHYQPKANLRTGRVASVEALIRWEHPTRGLMMPDRFIPLAQETGLIKPLTRYVVEEAARQCRRWEDEGLVVDVAVNISMRNLIDVDFPEDVAEALEAAGVSPERIELEVTESAIALDAARMNSVLVRLAEMGFRISIDDFGTGYSSLAYLRRLPITQIKIDRSFIGAMSDDEESAVIVRSTIDLGRNLGLEVVAEGVETREAWQELTRLGCDTGQGYLLSRPVPSDVLTGWLTNRADGDVVSAPSPS